MKRLPRNDHRYRRLAWHERTESLAMNPVGELLRVDDIRLDLDVSNKAQLLEADRRPARGAARTIQGAHSGEPDGARATGLDGRRSRVRHSARAHESVRDCDGRVRANEVRHTLRRTRWQAGVGLSRPHRSAQGERSASATPRHRRRHVQRPRVFATSSGPAPIRARCGRSSRRGRIRRLRRARPRL